MDSTTIMFSCQELGMRLSVEEKGIGVYPADLLTPELREAIKLNKPTLTKDLMLRDAYTFLADRYVEGADLTVLDGWRKVIGFTYLESDEEQFRYAVRGFTRAGLHAFRAARRGLAHDEATRSPG